MKMIEVLDGLPQNVAGFNIDFVNGKLILTVIHAPSQNLYVLASKHDLQDSIDPPTKMPKQDRTAVCQLSLSGILNEFVISKVSQPHCSLGQSRATFDVEYTFGPVLSKIFKAKLNDSVDYLANDFPPPSHIHTHELFMSTFGKSQIERLIRNIIIICKRNNKWVPLSKEMYIALCDHTHADEDWRYIERLVNSLVFLDDNGRVTLATTVFLKLKEKGFYSIQPVNTPIGLTS